MTIVIIFLIAFLLISQSRDVRYGGDLIQNKEEFERFQDEKHLYKKWKDNGMPIENNETVICDIHERYVAANNTCEEMEC